MARRSLGICRHLLPWSWCLLLLEAFLSTAGHPVPSPCNGDHGLASESCTTSGGQSLLQVTRSSYVQAPPEADAFDSGDTIVDEALADLDANSVPGMLSELKDTVSEGEFFSENEGIEGKKSLDNSDALQNPTQETEGKKSLDNSDVWQNPTQEPQSAGNAGQSRNAPVEQSKNLPAEQSGNIPGKAANVSAEHPGKVPGCTPSCKWSCSSPVCEEECEPLCKPGKCETRCSTMDLAGCMLGCEQPECATVCPKNHCAKDGCPKCSTNCSQPLCKLRCPQKQNCRSVCESPSCKWQCRKPQRCPQPKCKLECESQTKDCQKSLHEKLPELEKGEMKVASFVPPSSLLQMSHGQLTPAENSDHQQEVLHLGATVEAMDSETSQVSRFVVELPLVS